MGETPSDTADHPFVASVEDAVLCGRCGEHTTWHPMTAPQDRIAWLRGEVAARDAYLAALKDDPCDESCTFDEQCVQCRGFDATDNLADVAPALARRVIADYEALVAWEREWEPQSNGRGGWCGECGANAFTFDAPEHAADCPVTLTRAAIAEIERLGEG